RGGRHNRAAIARHARLDDGPGGTGCDGRPRSVPSCAASAVRVVYAAATGPPGAVRNAGKSASSRATPLVIAAPASAHHVHARAPVDQIAALMMAPAAIPP